MKVLWVGDAPTVSTGFARCTRAACGALHAAGHQVAVLGINESGDSQADASGWQLQQRYPYPIYVAQRRGKGDLFGAQRLAVLASDLQPDVIVLLQDPWNVDEYFDSLKEKGVEGIPVVGWLAVDAKNHPMSDELNQLAHIVTWTQFAIDELRKGGYTGTSSIVPLGVDTSVFKPGDRNEARLLICPPEVPMNAFIVGVVGRNQPRKRIDLAIAYFAEFIERHNVPDAHLFLHIAATGEKACDVRAVAAYYGSVLKNRIMMNVPSIGNELSEHTMAEVYRAFDVVLTTTQGEGWGLTTHEAMACGIPCIVPDWSALGEWPEDAVMKVPCTATALSAPLNMFPYTIGGVPDRDETVRALWRMYAYKELRREFSERGLALTARPSLQWSAIGEAFRLQLEAVIAGAAVTDEVMA